MIVASICFIFFGFCIVMMFVTMGANEKKKLQEQERKAKEEEQKQARQKQRDRDINSVISFAKNNGVDISGLIRERNNLYKQAIRNYVTGTLTKPLIPNTVKANYSGSIIGAFGDYRAEQINKERQQQYNDLLVSSNNSINTGIAYRTKYRTTEEKILNKLSEIPNSDKYIKILRKYFDEDDEVF